MYPISRKKNVERVNYKNKYSSLQRGEFMIFVRIFMMETIKSLWYHRRHCCIISSFFILIIIKNELPTIML